MMINKRLISEVPAVKMDMGKNVFYQWSGLLCGIGFSFFLTERYEMRVTMQEIMEIPVLWGRATGNVIPLNRLNKEALKEVIRKAEEQDSIDLDFREKIKRCDKKVSAVVYRNGKINGLAVVYPVASDILEISFLRIFEKDTSCMKDLIHHMTEEMLKQYGEQIQIRGLCRDEVSANMVSRLFPYLQPLLIHRGVCTTRDEE